MSARKFSRCPRSADRTFSGRLKTPKKAGKSENVKMPIPYQRLIKTTPPPSAQGASGPCHSKKRTFCTTVHILGTPRKREKRPLFFNFFLLFFGARNFFRTSRSVS